jgi:DNA-binding CsgD family transcriptional regulator
MDELPSTFDSARLQLVLPGTRSSFRRRLIDAMCALVPAKGSFCFLGLIGPDGRAREDATRLVDGASQPVPNSASINLSEAFGFDPKSVVTSLRRAYRANELWPESERKALPYFRDFSAPSKFADALLLFLHEGGMLFGLAGLERRADEPPFADQDCRALEALGPYAIAGARAQMRYDELAREAAALRALAKMSGAVYVVDRDRSRVVWAADRDEGLDWEEDVGPLEKPLAGAVEQWFATRTAKEAVPTPMRLPRGTIVSIARVEGDPVFGGARCAAVRVEVAKQGPTPIEGLSKREREIARLLVAGYSGVNVAAISGLSENTVRTYVRRLYAKLGVNNRADLVRKLVLPEPHSQTAPSSQITPPPESSLGDGDDTLD